MKDTTHVTISHINKVFPDGTKALHDINLEIRQGEIVVLLGPSGCGKSTLLRIIGGLEKKTSGEVFFYNKEITSTPVENRNAGFVFQNYALFPTMTVRQNIAFGLKLRKMPKEQIQEKVESLIAMMNLEKHASKKPHQLSGGQQQRVAIARVLAIEPKILLLDEPLTALDAKLKEQLRIDLSLMLRRLGITAIYVTHDQMEAMAIADRIAIMNGGVIEQIDTPEVIYSTPRTEFVAQFIGKINKLSGHIVYQNGVFQVDLGFNLLPYTGSQQVKVDQTVSVFIRPEDMHLVPPGQEEANDMKAQVEQCIFMGGSCHVAAKVGDQPVIFESSNTQRLEEDQTISIRINHNKIIVI